MHTASPSLRNWLIVVAGMIFFMIVLGALTRLTESGLSMVEWKPVTGVLPPMSDAAWQAELQKYLSSPQGRLVNRDFTVAQFQQIFWLEFLHRLWGRLIGLVFALPLAWFWLRGQTLVGAEAATCGPAGAGRPAGRAGLGDGGIGPRRPAFRQPLPPRRPSAGRRRALRLHDLADPRARRPRPRGATIRKTARKARRLIGFVFVVMTFGALMAGLRAGSAHNTFPTMSGYWIPPGLFDLAPWWINPFENGTTIQFIHRWLAKLLVLGVLALAGRAQTPTKATSPPRWRWCRWASASPPS